MKNSQQDEELLVLLANSEVDAFVALGLLEHVSFI
jgi:hypothetical protein